MTQPNRFIDVEIAPEVVADAELAKKLEEGCPVDIFAARSGDASGAPDRKDRHVEVVAENLDECILCEICVNLAPPGAVRVVKLYDGTALER